MFGKCVGGRPPPSRRGVESSTFPPAPTKMLVCHSRASESRLFPIGAIVGCRIRIVPSSAAGWGRVGRGRWMWSSERSSGPGLGNVAKAGTQTQRHPTCVFLWGFFCEKKMRCFVRNVRTAATVGAAGRAPPQGWFLR